MRSILVAIICLGFASLLEGIDLGNQAPVKTPGVYPRDVPEPQRQGGDTFATATVIPALPYHTVGSTIGYNDDYDEACPSPPGLAADVVYRYDCVETQAVDIDLCESEFDTKLYVYDSGYSLIACDDDFYFVGPCGFFTSRLENVNFNAGTTYYIVVDGDGTYSGHYRLAVDVLVTCVLDCPAGGVPEGEPPFGDGYVDYYNGGCLPDPSHNFQAITGNNVGETILCGVSGWYHIYGIQCRDTDWYILTAGPSGIIGVTVDAEQATYVFELGPQNCGTVGVLREVTGGLCAEAGMTITDYVAGSPVWIWVGPTVFTVPGGGDPAYDYVIWLTGLNPVVAAEPTTWGALKALYD